MRDISLIYQSIKNFKLAGTTTIYAGSSADGNLTVPLCWNFRTSAGSPVYLGPCGAKAIVTCFRPGD
jgi:hypothetical protein